MTGRSFPLRQALVVAGLLLLGWLTLAVTVDRIAASSAPATALGWNPFSADANARAAALAVAADPKTLRSPLIAARARRALERQPVQPEAARLLGLVALAQGRQAQAMRLLGYAEAMSRRDLYTQLALIQINVARGDVAGALLHYDRAMRAAPSSWALLFPVLARAADAPAVGMPLTGFLARRPPWGRPFLERFVPGSRSAPILYAIARRMGLDRQPSPDFAILQAIEKRLVDLGAYRPALALYNGAHGVSGSGPLLRDGGFEAQGGYDPFDWNLLDAPDLSAERDPSPAPGGGSALFLTAANGRGGDLATQVVLLAPGAYRISARVGAVGGDRLAFPQLLVRCASDGRELFHQPFPAAPAGGVTWRATLTIPADCPAERIVLQVRSPLETQNDVPWIDDLRLQPQAGR